MDGLTDNKIYENSSLKRILVDSGYIENGVYHYYLQDHLGNNRVVAKADGTVVQTNHYYPFGMAFAEGVQNSNQPFKYNGKELDAERGLNLYDYVARCMDAALGRFTTVEPLAEKYYSISPYVYCANNPINTIDPDGREMQIPPALWGVNTPLFGTTNPLLATGRMIGTADKVARVLPKEEHHIIPRSLKGNEVVKAAKEGGFKLEGKENKITVDKFSKTAGEGQHGKHPNYTRQVREKLVKYQERNSKPMPEQAANAVKEIGNQAKNAIENNPNTKINDLKLKQQILPVDNTKIVKPIEPVKIEYIDPRIS